MKIWLLRLFKAATICFVAALLLMAAVRVQQYAFRKRAKHLKSEIDTLKLGQSTFPDVQPLFERWDHDFGGQTCSVQQCLAAISDGDWGYRHLAFLSHHQNLLKIYGLLGGRLSLVFSSIRIRNNVLSYKSYEADIGVFSYEVDGAYGYTLMGVVETVENLPIIPSETAAVPATYHIGWPSGCEICVRIYVQFTPATNSADIQRLDRFDYSCLTRWINPCRTKEDILPAAWQEANTKSAGVSPL